MFVYRLIKDLSNWKADTICHLDNEWNLKAYNIHTEKQEIVFHKDDIERNNILNSEWFKKETASVMDVPPETIMYVIDENNDVIEKKVDVRPYYEYINAFLSDEQAYLQADKNEMIYDIKDFCHENGINYQCSNERYYHFARTPNGVLIIKDSTDRYINNPFRFESYDDALLVCNSFDIEELLKLFQ